MHNHMVIEKAATQMTAFVDYFIFIQTTQHIITLYPSTVCCNMENTVQQKVQPDDYASVNICGQYHCITCEILLWQQHNTEQLASY